MVGYPLLCETRVVIGYLLILVGEVSGLVTEFFVRRGDPGLLTLPMMTWFCLVYPY